MTFVLDYVRQDRGENSLGLCAGRSKRVMPPAPERLR